MLEGRAGNGPPLSFCERGLTVAADVSFPGLVSQLLLPSIPRDVAATDSDQWCTPIEIVDAVEIVLRRIDLDPCSNARSRVPARLHWTIDDDGDRPWTDGAGRGLRVFVNGPYSSPAWWMRRAAECGALGGHAIALPKLDPSTKWWAESATLAAARCDLRKRVRFLRPGKPSASPPWPSVLLMFSDQREMVDRFCRVMSALGDVWRRTEGV